MIELFTELDRVPDEDIVIFEPRPVASRPASETQNLAEKSDRSKPLGHRASSGISRLSWRTEP